MNLNAASGIPFGDSNSFHSFMMENEIAHIRFGAVLAQRGTPTHTLMPTGDPEHMPNWMLDHWLRHIDECATLDIAVPDISTVDLTDEQQFNDFMLLHGNLHRQQSLKLGITT